MKATFLYTSFSGDQMSMVLDETEIRIYRITKEKDHLLSTRAGATDEATKDCFVNLVKAIVSLH